MIIDQILNWCFEHYFLWARGDDYKQHIHHLIPLLYQLDRERATDLWEKATASFKKHDEQDP